MLDVIINYVYFNEIISLIYLLVIVQKKEPVLFVSTSFINCLYRCNRLYLRIFYLISCTMVLIYLNIFVEAIHTYKPNN